jgi:hypothetical protein
MPYPKKFWNYMDYHKAIGYSYDDSRFLMAMGSH